MEDALVRAPIADNKAHLVCSLNPCCNGRCTRTTLVKVLKLQGLKVLILVVMEDALVLP